jgi:hypothetical protein
MKKPPKDARLVKTIDLKIRLRMAADATVANSKIFLRIKKQRQVCHCSICGKELKFFLKRSEGPLTC